MLQGLEGQSDHREETSQRLGHSGGGILGTLEAVLLRDLFFLFVFLF